MAVDRRGRVRDYAAEERRRNELARERGYATRATERARKVRPPWQRAGFRNDYAYRQARREARQWSDAHTRQPVSGYRSTFTPEAFLEYYDAFVQGWGARRDTPEFGTRRAALRAWLVDVTHHLTREEWDDNPDY